MTFACDLHYALLGLQISIIEVKSKCSYLNQLMIVIINYKTRTPHKLFHINILRYFSMVNGLYATVSTFSSMCYIT